jgi:hypothetical protein
MTEGHFAVKVTDQEGQELCLGHKLYEYSPLRQRNPRPDTTYYQKHSLAAVQWGAGCTSQTVFLLS